MRKYLTIAICLILSTSSLNAQKGIFKNGSINKKHYSDTLKVETIRNVIIEKKEYRLILDTGAPTVFGSNIKADFITIIEDEIIDASNNTEIVKYSTIPQIKIGNLNYSNITAMQYDIAVLEEFNVDGILGANIMSKSIWDFDLINNQIIVTDKIDKKLVKSVDRVKLKLLDTGSPVTTIRHFNDLEEEIYIDLGFNGLYSLANSTFLKLIDKKLVKKNIQGRGEFSKTAFGKTDSIFSKVILNSKIGSLELPDFIAEVYYDEESSIGSELLNYYRTILDFKKKCMYLISYEKKISTEFKTFGVKTSTENNEMYISFVWFSSKAYKVGVRFKDKILSINGVSTKNPDTLSEEEKTQIKAFFKKNDNLKLELNSEENFIDLTKEILLN